MPAASTCKGGALSIASAGGSLSGHSRPVVARAVAGASASKCIVSSVTTMGTPTVVD